MQAERSSRILLASAGVLDCGMALYHFVLPYHMGWDRGLDGVAASLVWALHALNFSWSLLLLVTGVLILDVARLGPAAGAFARRAVFAIGFFWLVHGLYTWVSPLPVPRSLMWLRYVLGAFPVVTVTLHWLPLLLTRRTAR